MTIVVHQENGSASRAVRPLIELRAVERRIAPGTSIPLPLGTHPQTILRW